MAPKSTTVEAVLARIASRQHGVVTRAQLLGAGVTDDEVRHRLDCGALLREHWGVYRVGHRAPSVEARYVAAVFACVEGLSDEVCVVVVTDSALVAGKDTDDHQDHL